MLPCVTTRPRRNQPPTSEHVGKKREDPKDLPLPAYARNAALAALRASAGDAPCSTRALIAARWLGQAPRLPMTRCAQSSTGRRRLSALGSSSCHP
jgi:hypothetical protein